MDPRILVMKFGGTSVGTPAAMAQAVQIVRDSRESWPGVVAVTSALSGVTDLLLESARSAVRCELEVVERAAVELRRRHLEITASLVRDEDQRQVAENRVERLVSEFSQLLQAVAVLGEATPRALDAIASLG
jgi:aspartokinase/homoserine dehydrogenase 1